MNTGRKLAAAVAAEAAPRYLYWWLLLAVFFEYARPAAFVPGIEAFKLNSLIPLSLLVLCVFARGLRPVEDIIGDPLAKWLLIYFALIALSMVHGTVKLYAYNKFIQVLGYLFLFFHHCANRYIQPKADRRIHDTDCRSLVSFMDQSSSAAQSRATLLYSGWQFFR